MRTTQHLSIAHVCPRCVMTSLQVARHAGPRLGKQGEEMMFRIRMF